MDITILFLGDIEGKIGRKAVRDILPAWREKHKPDLVIANAENIAHGSGITSKSIKDVMDSGVDFFTSGNHAFRKEEGVEMLKEKNPIILRPANYPEKTPGIGAKIVNVGTKKLLVINLLGQVFIEEQDIESPFRCLDSILKEYENENLNGIIVDFHAEATSEKVALGWYADGRVSALLGTHTHVPTADAKILPQGTAYITDIGMVGPKESVIGIRKDVIINKFLDSNNPLRFEIPETGIAEFNAVLLTIDSQTKKAKNIKLIREETTIL